MKIAIICSLYLNNDDIKEWMDKSFASINTKHEYYFIVPKRVVDEKYEPLKYPLQKKPISIIELKGYYPDGCVRGLNLATQIAEGLDIKYIIYLSHDVVFKSDAIDNMIEFAENNVDVDVFGFSEHKDLETLETCENGTEVGDGYYTPVQMFRSGFLKKINYWDENFYPVYYEDFDMTIRMAKSGVKTLQFAGAKVYHKWSIVANTQPVYKDNQPEFNRGFDYYHRKWGSDSIITEFEHPFNDPNIDINFWELEEKEV